MAQSQTGAGLDATSADARPDGPQAVRGSANRTTLDGLVAPPIALSGRCLAPNARNHELAGEVKPLRSKRGDLRSRVAAISGPQPAEASSRARAGDFLAGDEKRRRLERDLHDGVQNELVALIVELTLVAEDRGTPHRSR
jgi:signal transduction histidine kinase